MKDHAPFILRIYLTTINIGANILLPYKLYDNGNMG